MALFNKLPCVSAVCGRATQDQCMRWKRQGWEITNQPWILSKRAEGSRSTSLRCHQLLQLHVFWPKNSKMRVLLSCPCFVLADWNFIKLELKSNSCSSNTKMRTKNISPKAVWSWYLVHNTNRMHVSVKHSTNYSFVKLLQNKLTIQIHTKQV